MSFLPVSAVAMDRLASLVDRLPKQLTEAWLPSIIIHALPRIRSPEASRPDVADPATLPFAMDPGSCCSTATCRRSCCGPIKRTTSPTMIGWQIIRGMMGLNHRAADDHVNRLLTRT